MSDLRQDLQTADGLARGHKYFIDATWIEVRKTGAAMAQVYNQDVELTYTEVNPLGRKEVFGKFAAGSGEFTPVPIKEEMI